MKRISAIVAGIAALVVGAADLHAETTVKLTSMHICCGACVNGITGAVKGVADAKVAVDKDSEEATITAKDAETAQKAVDAIAAAGYHAKVEGTEVSIKDENSAMRRKVKSITVSNAHNCCGGCTNAIKAAIKTVPGVTGDTCKSKLKEFTVDGDFDARSVIDALYAAGFHVTVK